MSQTQVKSIYQRMIDVQKRVTTIIKNEVVKMSDNDRGYKAVSHDDVAAALHLPLAEAGIVLLPDVVNKVFSEFEVEKKNNYGTYKQRWYRADVDIVVKWINADKPDEFIESRGSAFALDTSDKCFAKAYSLALKIVLLKVHLLESSDEEEKRIFEKDMDDNRGLTNAAKQKSSTNYRDSNKTTEKKGPIPRTNKDVNVHKNNENTEGPKSESKDNQGENAQSKNNNEGANSSNTEPERHPDKSKINISKEQAEFLYKVGYKFGHKKEDITEVVHKITNKDKLSMVNNAEFELVLQELERTKKG